MVDTGRLERTPSTYKSSLGNFSPTYASAFQWAQYNGLLSGLAGYGSSWSPWAAMTRGEAALVLYNLARKQ